MKKLLIGALFALTACGAAVNGGYQGTPIATLGGQLSLKQGLALTHEVRLAIAWYPDLSGDHPTAPKSIVTEEVAYTGTFPQSFTFRLFGPPAPAALAPIFDDDGAQAGKAAVGQLVAYEDLDGDGKLSVDAQGRASDRILGSTAGAGAFDFYTVAERHLVLWAQDGATLGLPGVQPGYNLLHYTDPFAAPEVLPLTSAIPLELTGEPRLALISCPEAYVDPQPETACGVRVWETPAVNGTIAINETGSIDAFVMVSTSAGTSSTATVRINGTVIPHDSSGLAHTLTEPTPSSLHVGLNTIEVEQPGYEPVTLQATVPGPFSLTAPADGATITAGAPLTVSWTPAAGATVYGATLFVGHAGNDASELVRGATSVQLDVPNATGLGDLSVVAYDRLVIARTAILGLSVQRVALDVVP